jgi:hypothetical protein
LRFCRQCGKPAPVSDATCGEPSCRAAESRDDAAREEAERDRAEWRREIAMEEGMLHGVNAYNDAMGYSLGDPDADYDPHRGY